MDRVNRVTQWASQEEVDKITKEYSDVEGLEVNVKPDSFTVCNKIYCLIHGIKKEDGSWSVSYFNHYKTIQ